MVHYADAFQFNRLTLACVFYEALMRSLLLSCVRSCTWLSPARRKPEPPRAFQCPVTVPTDPRSLALSPKKKRRASLPARRRQKRWCWHAASRVPGWCAREHRGLSPSDHIDLGCCRQICLMGSVCGGETRERWDGLVIASRTTFSQSRRAS